MHYEGVKKIVESMIDSLRCCQEMQSPLSCLSLPPYQMTFF